MQPYFFPYLGYFQLIKAVDVFVVYDNIEFTKKGWMHRNRLLFNNKVDYFTINISKDSDYLNVVNRKISPVYFNKEMPKILRKIHQNYNSAPFFEEIFPILKEIFEYEENNLFKYIYNSLLVIINYLNLQTKIKISSSISIDHDLKNKWRLFEISRALKIENYVNPIGGHDLYHKTEFASHGIELYFLKPNLPTYNQNNSEFFPGLSIIDVMMYNSKEDIGNFLNQYELK